MWGVGVGVFEGLAKLGRIKLGNRATYSPTGDRLFYITYWETGQTLRFPSGLFLISLNINILRTILVLTSKATNLAGTTIIFISKSRDQNCPGLSTRIN